MADDPAPRRVQLERGLKVIGGSGIAATQRGNDIVLGLRQELALPPPKRVDESSAQDPLKYMSFRATLIRQDSGDVVELARSYVDSVYYNDPYWRHETLEIESEQIEVGGYPRYLYFEIPVEWISGRDTPNGSFPAATNDSEAQIIEGNPYYFRHSYSTGYVRRRRDVTPDSYYSLVEEAPGVLDQSITDEVAGSTNRRGTWRFLIAELTEAEGVRQIHLGPLVLPQPFTFNLLTTEVI